MRLRLISEWIETNGYIPVSRNRRAVPGIFLIRSKAVMAQRIDDDLLMIRQASEAGEYRNQIGYLSLQKYFLSGYHDKSDII